MGQLIVANDDREISTRWTIYGFNLPLRNYLRVLSKLSGIEKSSGLPIKNQEEPELKNVCVLILGCPHFGSHLKIMQNLFYKFS